METTEALSNGGRGKHGPVKVLDRGGSGLRRPWIVWTVEVLSNGSPGRGGSGPRKPLTMEAMDHGSFGQWKRWTVEALDRLDSGSFGQWLCTAGALDHEGFGPSGPWRF